MLQAVSSFSGLSSEVVTYSYIHNMRLSREWMWRLWFYLWWGHVASVTVLLAGVGQLRLAEMKSYLQWEHYIPSNKFEWFWWHC